MANLIERREYTPKRFYAGEFPVVTETGTAGGAIALYDLVMSSDKERIFRRQHGRGPPEDRKHFRCEGNGGF